MEDKLTIRLNIADRNYPLNIERKDEERIRKAAKTINEIVIKYKNKYSNNEKDNQDFLAMAALQFVTQLQDIEEKQDITPIIEKLKNLDTELGDYLKEKN